MGASSVTCGLSHHRCKEVFYFSLDDKIPVDTNKLQFACFTTRLEGNDNLL